MKAAVSKAPNTGPMKETISKMATTLWSEGHEKEKDFQIGKERNKRTMAFC